MVSTSESFQKGEMHCSNRGCSVRLEETAYMFSAFSGFLPNLFSILSMNKFFHKRGKNSSNSWGNLWGNQPSGVLGFSEVWGTYKNVVGRNESVFHFSTLKLIQNNITYDRDMTFPFAFPWATLYIWKFAAGNLQSLGQEQLFIVPKPAAAWSQFWRVHFVCQNKSFF